MVESKEQHELELTGWTRQATYDEPRLSEMVEVYQDLGFEVRLEPFATDGQAECEACMAQQPDRFKTIFTRKKQPAP